MESYKLNGTLGSEAIRDVLDDAPNETPNEPQDGASYRAFGVELVQIVP